MHGTFTRPHRCDGRRSAGLTLRLALRELRGGLSGFVVFIACIAIGVAAIAGVTSTSRSLREGLGREGRRILGGDLTYSLINREATQAEKAVLDQHAPVSVLATLRAMAVAADGEAGLVELKAVDDTYPAAGTLAIEPQVSLHGLLAERGGVYGAVADPALLIRLGLEVGDRITIAGKPFEIRARLVSEPDAIAAGVGFGPRVIIGLEALRATGLVEPGSLNRWSYRLQMPQASDMQLEAVSHEIGKALPDAGWEVRSRLNADPRYAKSVERFTQFLTLVGLTALIVGGVGVANAVRSFVERKRASIATLKSVGAPGSQVVALYLTQVMLIAAFSIAIGLVVGAALPFLADALLREQLPLPLEPTIAPAELALAACYGFLTAFAFAILPLGRAHDVPVSGLFRDTVDPAGNRARLRYRITLVVTLLALTGLALATAFDRRVALIFMAAAGLSFGSLRLVATGVMALTRRLPHPRAAGPRMALANLHRPGALTPAIVLSLGLGVTLLVTLSIIDANLTRSLNGSLPGRAPNLFFLDIPSRDAETFDAFLGSEAPDAKLEHVPMLRGRIVALDGVPVEKIKPPDDAAWVLDGDRGITTSDILPDGSILAEGSWWDTEQGKTPMLSFEADLGKALGLKIGSTVTVNMLGRTLTTRIANFRKVEWRSLGINFVMVFSPGTFKGAPHSDIATLTLPGGPNPAREATILRDVAKRFPSVTSVRVKDALETVDRLVRKLTLAIRGASAVAILASLFVLAGAIAAGHGARLYDAVVLKVLGATRRRLLIAYGLEYIALGCAAAAFGLFAGSVASWAIVTKVMRLDFTLEIGGALLASAGSVLVAIIIGLGSTWRILGQKAAPYLRQF